MPETQQGGIQATSVNYAAAHGNTHQILNPLSKARNQIHILTDTLHHKQELPELHFLKMPLVARRDGAKEDARE